MPEVNFNNFIKIPAVINQPKSEKEKSVASSPIENNTDDNKELLENLRQAERQNGLTEKVMDTIKAYSGVGISAKTVKQAISDGKNKEETEDLIKNYRRSQERGAQGVADVLSAGASFAVFFKIKQFIQIQVAKHIRINNVDGKSLKKILDEGILKKFDPEKIIKYANKKSTAITLAVIPAMFVGGFVKSLFLKLNRIGTKQYSPEYDKSMDKAEIKEIKRSVRGEKRRANLRNFTSGMINGLTAPILGLGGFVGAPIYLAVNSLNRYFVGTREDRGEKDFGSYWENIKTTPILSSLVALGVLIPAFRKGQYNKVFDKNLEKVVAKLKDAKLSPIGTGKSSYKQLEEILFDDAEVSKLLKSGLEMPQKIQQLSDRNIFILKFKQIGSNADELAKALKNECPPTRTIEEAQSYLNKVFGEGEYTIERLAGVGTVAETYLVRAKDGKGACIKMLKNGITAEKITKDKEAVIEMIKALPDRTDAEKEFLIKNFENIYKGVLSEIDLSNEMKAAGELAKVTKQAKVVKPIKVKDNVYVMEKAEGICLQDLSKYLNAASSSERRIEYLEKELQSAIQERNKYWAEYCRKELAEIKAAREKLAEIGDLTEKEALTLLEKYQDVLVEQFSKVDANGKIIHGDIHPGNIFVDLKAMRAGKKDFITLIDTGNTITQDKEMAIRFLNLTKYIHNADVENLTNFVLEGAKLPEGMTREKAFVEISKALKTAFFDDKTAIGNVTTDSFMAITDGILQKLKIVPADTQGNLIKCKTSANQSLNEFRNSFFEKLLQKAEDNLAKKGIDINGGAKQSKGATLSFIGEGLKIGAKSGKAELRYVMKKRAQEKRNLLLLPPQVRAKIKRSASAPAHNSEDYLTYVIKQGKRESTPKLSDLEKMSQEELEYAMEHGVK